MVKNKNIVEDSPDILADIAYDYYVNAMDQKALAIRYDVNQATVARWLKKARDRGVVSFSIDRSFAVTVREELPLSMRLRDAFELKDCAVVNVNILEGESKNRGDQLHTGLAIHNGTRVRERLSSGDHIAVAGGRAVNWLAKFIKRNPRPAKEIRITPLCGRLWTGEWQVGGSDILEQPLDADDNAFVLAVAFDRELGTRFSQIGHPLYTSGSAEACHIMKEHCAFLPDGGWNWGLKAPNRAFVGVGVVAPGSGHRISAFLKKRSLRGKDAPYLSRANPELKEAMGLVQKNNLPFLGDVANRLFPVLPLPDQLKHHRLGTLESKLGELTEILNCLNEKSITVSWKHLRDVETVCAIAGGELKAGVIWTLLIASKLKPMRRVVTELCTDNQTAKVLMQALNSLRTEVGMLNWYRDVIEKMDFFC
jgi:DNA-binding transcriptional regulator LsrR (DeoR family)